MSSKISREKARISDVESFSIKKACVGVTMNKYDNNMFLRIKRIVFLFMILVKYYQHGGNTFQLNVNFSPLPPCFFFLNI